MAFEHLCRCDAINPDGSRCETRSLAPGAHNPPAGWHSIVKYEKATAENSALAPYMAPIVSAGKELEEKRRAAGKPADDGVDVADLSEKMIASFAETAPPVAVYAHLCPRHELPKVAFATSPGMFGC